MFWNLITTKYERYHLSHFIMLLILALYSLLGAVIFCALEAPHEMQILTERAERHAKQMQLARNRLLYDLQYYFVREINVSRLLSKELNVTLNYYDRLMGFDVDISSKILNPSKGNIEMKWTIWGGLYFAGTIYTTIGYGDIVAETIWGKLFTVIYALIGIPLVITLLNIWGGGLFHVLQMIWRSYIFEFGRKLKYKKNLESEEEREFITAEERKDSEGLMPPDENSSLAALENEKLPFGFALCILLTWILLCALLFSTLQNWTFFDAAYFFFISLTTIGFGDSTAEHKVACMYFLLILIGLSIVSMSINVIQLQLEILFAKIVHSIDNDFKKNLTATKRKHSMATSIGEERKISAHTIAIRVTHDKVPEDDENEDLELEKDAIKKYSQTMPFSERILSKLMSKHQRRMLNQKMEERKNQHNAATQTEQRHATISAQTDKQEDVFNKYLSMGYGGEYEASTDSEEESQSANANKAMAVQPGGGGGKARRITGGGSPPKTSGGITGSSSSGVGSNRTLLGGGMVPAGVKVPRGLSRKKLYIYNIGD